LKKIFCILLFVSLTPSLWADDTAINTGPEQAVPEPYNIHYQMTILPQYHPAFPAKYTSPTTSLQNTPELNSSFTTTLFLGFTPWTGGFLYADPEIPAGSGFSQVTGLADFPNGEISKVGTTNPVYNQARLYFQQVFGLGGAQESIDDDQNQLACKEDISRFTVTAGKYALGDFFDNNAFAHDPRTQFMNEAFVTNTAWDYAADTHGYTIAVQAELNQKSWAFRFAEAMVSTDANGPIFDTHFPEARSENAELEWRYGADTTAGRLRFLAYANHAHMGYYQDALNASPIDPDITSVRQYSEKIGLGLNWEQNAGADLGFFARLGWNDGQTETWMFTAVDQVATLGLSLKGNAWGRALDQAGLGFAIAGLSAVHRAYLAAGGQDFDLGDGALNYAPEEMFELYYLYKPIQQIGLTLDFQGFNNPAYNQDRGPVGVVAGRFHFEI
jgi:high affinity Mn2+ porin